MSLASAVFKSPWLLYPKTLLGSIGVSQFFDVFDPNLPVRFGQFPRFRLAPMYVVHEAKLSLPIPVVRSTVPDLIPTRFGSPLIATGEGRIIDAILRISLRFMRYGHMDCALLKVHAITSRAASHARSELPRLDRRASGAADSAFFNLGLNGRPRSLPEARKDSRVI